MMQLPSQATRRLNRRVVSMYPLRKLVGGLFLLSGSLSATPIACSDPSLLTLENYIGLGSSGCTVGDKLFFGFFYVNVGGVVSTADIGVTGFNSPTPGLRFGPFLVKSPTDIGIGYNVLSLTGPTIKGASLSIAGAGGAGSWAAAVTETACFGMIIVNAISCEDGSSPASILSAFVFPPDSSAVSSTTFPAVGLLGLFKDIILIPGSGPLAVSFVDNRFTPIPEPATMAMVGAGFLVLTWYWKRRRRP